MKIIPSYVVYWQFMSDETWVGFGKAFFNRKVDAENFSSKLPSGGTIRPFHETDKEDLFRCPTNKDISTGVQ